MLAIMIVVVLVVATATTTTTTTTPIIAQESSCGVAYGPTTLGVDLTPWLISIDPLARLYTNSKQNATNNQSSWFCPVNINVLVEHVVVFRGFGSQVNI